MALVAVAWEARHCERRGAGGEVGIDHEIQVARPRDRIGYRWRIRSHYAAAANLGRSASKAAPI